MELKNKFLASFISLASLEGINENTLLKASNEVYDNERGYVLDFYNGLYEIVEAIEDLYDYEIEKNLELNNIKSVTEKVRQSLKARIYGHGERQAIYKTLSKFYLTKAGISILAKCSWKTVDRIWRLAGDTSLDFNYYSKRAILFTIYTTSRGYYLSNNDENFEKTQKKIDKALSGVKKFAIIKQKFKPENIPFIRLFTK